MIDVALEGLQKFTLESIENSRTGSTCWLSNRNHLRAINQVIPAIKMKSFDFSGDLMKYIQRDQDEQFEITVEDTRNKNQMKIISKKIGFVDTAGKLDEVELFKFLA